MTDATSRLASVPRRPVDLVRWAAIIVALVVAAPAVADGSVAAIIALAIAVGYGVFSTLRAHDVHLLEDVAFLLAVIAAAIAADELLAFLALVVVSLAIAAVRDFADGERVQSTSARRSPTGGLADGPGGLGVDELPRLVAANERRRAIRAAGRASEWLTFAMVGLERLPHDDPRIDELRDDMEAALEELRTRVDLVVEDDAGGDLQFDERLNAIAEGARDLYGWAAATDIAPERDVSAPAAPLIRQALLDITAEALDNAGRHSSAETVTVQWSGEGDARRLTITDDGFGFDLAERAGAGIEAMARTARAIGAAFDIASETDVGTSVTVLIPGSRLRGAATTAGGE
ncbi:MAG: hypothetical protein AAGA90_21935 [Actinomycetota bacterium]